MLLLFRPSPRILRFTHRLRSFSASSRTARLMSSTATSTAKVEPTNQHFSVDADGKACVDLTFEKEPLGLQAKDGYGWPQMEFNQAVGPGDRYIICRKLGWGMSSSTWLARDQVGNSYVALKILSGYCTELVEKNRIWELEVLKQISRTPQTPHALSLLSHFTFPGKGTAGNHLCLVTKLLGGDIKSLFEKHGIFPLPLAKRILLHMLRALAHAHERGVMHTDLKHDNIYFDTSMSTEAIDEILASDPPRRHLPEASHDGIMEVAVSQPLPLPTLQEAMKLNYVVADFGSARPFCVLYSDDITSPPLRAPEVIIGGPRDSKADIWTFGCLVFEFITGRAFFKYVAKPEYDLDESGYLLYQMICFTLAREDGFSAEQLQVSPLAKKYFDLGCNLRSDPPLFNYPFEQAIGYFDVEPAEIIPMADFMRRCLRLDPTNRASAAELLFDPWFDGVD